MPTPRAPRRVQIAPHAKTLRLATLKLRAAITLPFAVETATASLSKASAPALVIVITALIAAAGFAFTIGSAALMLNARTTSIAAQTTTSVPIGTSVATEQTRVTRKPQVKIWIAVGSKTPLILNSRFIRALRGHCQEF